MENIIPFLTYAGSSIACLLVGLFLFELTTKLKEFQLIKEGNEAAALSLGGKLLGLAFVLGSSIAHSLSIPDMLLWGAIGIIAQIVFFHLSEWVTVRFNISQAIASNNRAVGIMHLLFSLSIGWVLAQCLIP